MSPSGLTLSDFDFVWPDSDDARRENIRSELLARLGEVDGVGVPKISVHPSESFASMPLVEQRLFNVAELSMGVLAGEHESEGYVLGKGLLMLARCTPDETLWDAATRTLHQSVFLVRIGCIQLSDLDEKDWKELRAARTSIGLTADSAIANPNGAAEELERYFAGRYRDTGAWIYKRVGTKLAQALRRY